MKIIDGWVGEGKTMTQEFRMQDPGEGIHEGEIVDLHITEGSEIREGEPLLAVETDKAVVDVPSPFTGRVESVKVKVGDVAQVGDVLLTYRESGEPAAAAPTPARGETATEVLAGAPKEPSPAKKPSAEPPMGAPAGEPVAAAPSTRRLARELGVDLHQVTGSGPAGRVTPEDVRAVAGKGRGEAAEGPVAAQPAAPSPAVQTSDRWGPIEQIPLHSIRRITAERTAKAWAEIPHVMHQDLADITELERFRRAHKARVEAEGGKLTFTVLMIKALAAALKRFPRFNATLDSETNTIIVKHYYHIGVAVDTENGLLVPVLKDVDRKSIVELSIELAQLAEKTRQGKATRDDLQGSTFTITNPGSIGGTAFTPIINYPEAAIMGMAQSRLTPVAEGDLERPRTDIRLLLPLCLTFDHRINDGADAARFVRHIADNLAEPERLLLSA